MNQLFIKKHPNKTRDRQLQLIETSNIRIGSKLKHRGNKQKYGLTNNKQSKQQTN